MTEKHEQKIESSHSQGNPEASILTKEKDVGIAEPSAKSHHQNTQSSIPDEGSSILQPQINSSQLCNSENGDTGSDVNLDPLDETEMQRHLNDVESSFMPVLSPISVDRKKGADDTFVFDVAHSEPKSGAEIPQHTTDISPNLQSLQGAAQRDEHSSDRDQNLSSSMRVPATINNNLETGLITPTPSERKSKFLPTVESEDKYTEDIINKSQEKMNNEETHATEKGGAESSNGQSTLRHFDKQKSSVSKIDVGSKVGGLLNVRKYASRRSKILRGRSESQHSSISSLGDSNVGLDYALQAGGAVPACGVSRQSSITLSRTISLGSMASRLEDSGDDSGQGTNNNLSKLQEEKPRQKSVGGKSPPETPRVSGRSLAAPTDTIIARHVRNVHVPEAVAIEYRSKNRVASLGTRSNLPGHALSRAGKNLTLKEQSSTIERLSKENFDLKLKVMFLSDRLDKLSEEGVKDMISENVELKTGLAIVQRDNKALKRKVKELEKQLKKEEDRPSTSQCSTTFGESPKWADEEGTPEWEEELLYLREKVEEYVTEIEKLRSDAVSRENQRRRLAETVRQIGEHRGQDTDNVKEVEFWKDLLEQENARYERIEEENKKMREENLRLKSETHMTPSVPGLNHTTNIYNITKKRKASLTRPKSSMSDRWEDRNGSISAASTLVEELRKESEQLRHENAELRREVGAQTSMLTSRNREKERLYQEIEELKMGQRMGSVIGSNILDRSASRSLHTSLSQTYNRLRDTNIDENEREEFENKNAELRDGINGLKIQNQDLQRELKSCMRDFEIIVAQKKEAESLANVLREALEIAETDLLTMQSERDEALQNQEDVEIALESIRKEAQQELDSFSVELEDANAEIIRLQVELANTSENFSSLQTEMRKMSQALLRLEDDHGDKSKRIQELEKDLEEANRESEQLEKNLVAANEKISRLTVQQESSQGEIIFLRDEQEGDKIKIGNLEAAAKSTEELIDNMRGRIRDLEHKLFTERGDKDALETKLKQELEQKTNEINRELSIAKIEAKRLRRKDAEAAEWKQKLNDLEDQLRTALGEIDGTRSSFLQSITKLHHELEDTVHELDSAKKTIGQKDRIIKERDELLESHALEARKLADLLDKERQIHRNTKHQYEIFQKTSQLTTRNLSQQENRVIELENARQHDRRKINSLENQFKDQMLERNQLLLTLWKRLSDLCGTDWTHDNSLINGRALPSLESITTMLPGFSKNILGAVKKIESLFVAFTSRIDSVEKDLWKDYQTLEVNLEARSKRLDQLEVVARTALSVEGIDGRSEIERLREQIKNIGAEISPPRASKEIQLGGYQDGSPNSSLVGSRFRSGNRSRASTIRHHSSASVETTETNCRSRNGSDSKAEFAREHQNYFDPKWTTRLFELEEKYKAEREARLLDRTAARQRLDEKSKDNEELAQEIERLRMRIHASR